MRLTPSNAEEGELHPFFGLRAPKHGRFFSESQDGGRRESILRGVAAQQR